MYHFVNRFSNFRSFDFSAKFSAVRAYALTAEMLSDLSAFDFFEQFFRFLEVVFRAAFSRPHLDDGL